MFIRRKLTNKMQMTPDYYWSWLEFFRKRQRLRHLIHFHFKSISLFPSHLRTRDKWSNTGMQFSHQWFVDSQIVWIVTTSQPVASGVMKRDKKKGVRKVRWRYKLNCFLRKRPWYLYRPCLLTSHWPERSGKATSSSQLCSHVKGTKTLI